MTSLKSFLFHINSTDILSVSYFWWLFLRGREYEREREREREKEREYVCGGRERERE